MRFVLFGAPYLAGADGARFEIPETAPAYLALFLAARRQWCARDSVAAHLWPELPDSRAQHNLRVALNRLGTLLDRWDLGAALKAERRRLRLDAASDLASFQAALDAGDWQAASELPAGPLLDGVQFTPYPALAEWLGVEREAARRAWRRALFEAASGGAAIDAALGRYLAAYPSDGEMAALQAARLGAVGRGAEARDVIASFSRAASEELAPDELRANVRQLEHAAAGLASVAGKSVGAVEAIGRESELAQLQAALDSHRWVTVVGLPGSGKSTLVQTWLGRQTGQGPSPTVVVNFNERTTASSAADAIASALVPTSQRVARGRQPVGGAVGRVVLDGLDPGSLDADMRALFHELTAACPGVHVLATSRGPLAVPGERVLRIGGLSVRRGEDDGLSEAGRLFAREARRIASDFDATGREAAIESIARASGGLPLAIKLAAAWSRWLDVAAIERALERSVGRRPGALDDSLHDWLEPVWTRLSSGQRAALASLSLLPAAFDMTSATAVTGAAPELVESLIDSSLVDVEEGPPVRLHLHALVRMFVKARLDESISGRRAAIGRFVVLVQARLGSAGDVPANADHLAGPAAQFLDDLLAAWPLAIEVGALDAMSVFSAALLQWHEIKGEYGAGEHTLAKALDALDESQPAEAALLARLQTARATLLYRASDYDACEHLAREAARLAHATGQATIHRRATNVLGLACWKMQRLDEAKGAFEIMLTSAIADGDARGERVCTNNLALVEKSRGDFATAEMRFRRALELDRGAQSWSSASTVLNNLANLLRHQHRLDECEVLAHEALRLAQEHGLNSQRPFALIGLALLQYEAGKPERAAAYLDLIDSCDAGSVEGPVHAGAAHLRAQLALDRGDSDAALRHIGAALDVCVRTDDPANRAEALDLYGVWLASQTTRRDEAVRLWTTLLRSLQTDATLHDQLKRRLIEAGADPTLAALPEPDLVLVTQQAIAASRRTGSA